MKEEKAERRRKDEEESERRRKEEEERRREEEAAAERSRLEEECGADERRRREAAVVAAAAERKSAEEAEVATLECEVPAEVDAADAGSEAASGEDEAEEEEERRVMTAREGGREMLAEADESGRRGAAVRIELAGYMERLQAGSALGGEEGAEGAVIDLPPNFKEVLAAAEALAIDESERRALSDVGDTCEAGSGGAASFFRCVHHGFGVGVEG